MDKIFILDNCTRLHTQQFGCCYPEFSHNVELAINQAGIFLKVIDGEYHGLYTYTGNDKKPVIIDNQGPFSNTTKNNGYFEVLKSETILSYGECITNSTKRPINYDKLIVLTASMYSTDIISDNPTDMVRWSTGIGYQTSILSFWDLLIAIIHHSGISLSRCLFFADILKKEGFSLFHTKFWEGDRKISNRCIFCEEDVTEYAEKFKRKNQKSS